MSIIIYDVPCEVPHRLMEELRSYFCCGTVVIADDFDPFPLSEKQQQEFKDGTILFLTDVNPVNKDYSVSARRAFPFKVAVTAVGVPSHAN